MAARLHIRTYLLHGEGALHHQVGVQVDGSERRTQPANLLYECVDTRCVRRSASEEPVEGKLLLDDLAAQCRRLGHNAFSCLAGVLLLLGRQGELVGQFEDVQRPWIAIHLGGTGQSHATAREQSLRLALGQTVRRVAISGDMGGKPAWSRHRMGRLCRRSGRGPGPPSGSEHRNGEETKRFHKRHGEAYSVKEARGAGYSDACWKARLSGMNTA